jgi:hypothetical protein
VRRELGEHPMAMTGTSPYAFEHPLSSLTMTTLDRFESFATNLF